MLSYHFISYSRNIFGFVFNYLIICVWDLYWCEVRSLNGLIVSDCLYNWNWNSQTCLMLFFIFSLICQMLMRNNRFIISIKFLYWNILNLYFSLWFRLLYNLIYSVWSLHYWLIIFYRLIQFARCNYRLV